MATVRICNVTKSFGENTVLNAFNETFLNGEFITLLGPSGCGKTTMLRIIAGFEKPTDGEVYLNDRLVSGGKTFVPPEKRNIGMVFQSYAVWPHMNVFDNVAYPLTIQRKSREQIRENVERVLDIVHLRQYALRLPSQLSGGQQQRVALARALVAEPELLLLDEPLSNLDAKLRESMRFEIKEIQRSLGMTVVYVTHDQTEAMAMSDRIILINQGKIQQVGTPAEIYNHPINPFVADFLGKVDFFRGIAESGTVRLDGGTFSLPYDGEKRGTVVVAVRPERITLSTQAGELQGRLETQYYLGDVNDCRVRAGNLRFRVVAPPESWETMKPGDPVFLTLRDKMVFDDDGSLDKTLEIKT